VVLVVAEQEMELLVLELHLRDILAVTVAVVLLMLLAVVVVLQQLVLLVLEIMQEMVEQVFLHLSRVLLSLVAVVVAVVH
jgi:hypothetical protein